MWKIWELIDSGLVVKMWWTIALGNFLFNLRLLMLETCLAITVNVNVNQNLIFAQLISKQQNHMAFIQNDVTKKYHHFCISFLKDIWKVKKCQKKKVSLAKFSQVST